MYLSDVFKFLIEVNVMKNVGVVFVVQNFICEGVLFGGKFNAHHYGF